MLSNFLPKGCLISQHGLSVRHHNPLISAYPCWMFHMKMSLISALDEHLLNWIYLTLQDCDDGNQQIKPELDSHLRSNIITNFIHQHSTRVRSTITHLFFMPSLECDAIFDQITSRNCIIDQYWMFYGCF